jgi:hypothetical protein
VPGTNRLSEWAEEDELASRDDPLPGVFAEDRGEAGTDVATVRVAKTSASASTLCPQIEQKRLFSAISLAQDEHLIMTGASHDRTDLLSGL